MQNAPSHIMVRCPRCKHESEEPLGQRREDPEITCPVCGYIIALSLRQLYELQGAARAESGGPLEPRVDAVCPTAPLSAALVGPPGRMRCRASGDRLEIWLYAPWTVACVLALLAVFTLGLVVVGCVRLPPPWRGHVEDMILWCVCVGNALVLGLVFLHGALRTWLDARTITVAEGMVRAGNQWGAWGFGIPVTVPAARIVAVTWDVEHLIDCCATLRILATLDSGEVVVLANDAYSKAEVTFAVDTLSRHLGKTTSTGIEPQRGDGR